MNMIFCALSVRIFAEQAAGRQKPGKAATAGLFSKAGPKASSLR